MPDPGGNLPLQPAHNGELSQVEQPGVPVGPVLPRFAGYRHDGRVAGSWVMAASAYRLCPDGGANATGGKPGGARTAAFDKALNICL